MISGRIAGGDLAVVDVTLGAVVAADRVGGIRAGVVLADLGLILGDVEAGLVEDVVDVEVEEDAEAIGQLEVLAEGEVKPLLHGLAKDVALVGGGEVGLVDVLRVRAGGDRHAFVARGDVVDGDVGRVDGGDVRTAGGAEVTGVAGESPGLGLPGVGDGEDGVEQGGKVAEVGAADGSVELIEGVGLATLDDADAVEAPAVGGVGEQGVGAGEIGEERGEVGGEDVGAVEVRRGVGLAQVVGVVAGEEEADVGLLVERVAVGVADATGDVVGEPLFDVGLEGVVGGGADGLKEGGVGAVADVGDAEVGIASVLGVPRLAGDRGVVVALIVGGVENLEAVSRGLPMNGIVWGGDAGLVEGDGDDGVTAAVAVVAEREGEVVARLPLEVEGVVDGVGEDVVLVVGAEVEGGGTVGVVLLVIAAAAVLAVLRAICAGVAVGGRASDAKGVLQGSP